MIKIHNYENISSDMTIEINTILIKLKRLSDKLTDSEKQYSFLTQLQALPLTEDQVFNIYCNTDLNSL